MSVLNEILGFFIKRRIERINLFRLNPHETQDQQFKELIVKAKKTEFGKKYGFAEITSFEDFKARVPIVAYEEYYPYIERVLKGEQNIIWPSQINLFSKSSGTTNAKSKYIPVSEESLESSHYKGGKDLLTLYLTENPESKLFDGKSLSIGGSLQDNPFNSKTEVGDISAIIMQNLPSWAEYLRTPPLEVALLENWEEKLTKMVEICSKEDLTSIMGVPTWTVVFLERVLKETGAKNLAEVWPNFELFVHGAVNFQPYRELFKTKFFPQGNVRYLETYNASEGYFAVQDDLTKDGEMLLMLDYGIFYEFIPMDTYKTDHEKVLLLSEVEIGVNYAMVITTNAGLWRYKIGDTMRFTSRDPYRIKISGRTRHHINVFGEELIVENAERGLRIACLVHHAEIVDYTVGPIFMEGRNKGGHHWLIEFKKAPKDLAAFTDTLDQELKAANSDYQAKRHGNITLNPPVVEIARPQLFYQWLESKEKLGGQHKVPRLSNKRDFLEEMLARNAS